MRNTWTLLLLLTTLIISAQDFEGKIVYRNAYKSKIQNLTSDQLTTMLGTKQEYFIKAGNYKSITNGTLSQWQLYINQDNKLYTKLYKNDTIFWQNASVSTDSVLSFKINKRSAKICGYDCDELVLKCKNSTQRFYFCSKLKIDSKLFKKHTYNMWYDYLRIANSVPLKIVFENAQLIIENTAEEVQSAKLDEKDFQLPLGSPTAKSRF